jgi:uncharacterized ubiquitin-like protein YukD
METLVVTLQVENNPRNVWDLELSSDVAMRRLIPSLASALPLSHSQSRAQSLAYKLVLMRNGRQRALKENETLRDAGVLTGDQLSLVSRGGSVSAPQMIHQAGPRSLLHTAGGQVIALDSLNKSQLRVGRYDARTGQAPEIDLSREPNNNTISRSHAMLHKQRDRWMIEAISTRSPTLINGKCLSPQQVHPLQDGDEIKLGDVRLLFEVV